MPATARDVTIVDVFPRDGLQTLLHEPHLRTPSTAEKIAIIERLDAANVPEIEITGFVHPRVIPSLADADVVAREVLARPHKAAYKALVPNVRGAERAMAVGVPTLVCLIIASETYQRLNSNMSIERNLDEITTICREATAGGFKAAVGMGTVFVCPYEGVQSEDHILRLVERIANAGVTEMSVADSVGMAWPTLVRDRIRSIQSRFPQMRLGLHLHTLAGLALANAFAAWEVGVRSFEGSVGGIGGGIAMPVHTTTMGNVATEDLVYMFEQCGARTGIDQAALTQIGRDTQQMIGAGHGFTTTFGTMEAFLKITNHELERMRAAPPGDSRAQAAK
jgi:hydroxymethylglutaryl-CoA lyase